MNLFDTLQQNTFNVVKNTMGYDASWTPTAGGDSITAKVLLNQPTKDETVSDIDYDALHPSVEYFEADLPGLYESVSDNINEVITINGNNFNCYHAIKKYDGKTIIIDLKPV